MFVQLPMPRQNDGTQDRLDGIEDPVRKQRLQNPPYREEDFVTVDTEMATYKGYVHGFNRYIGPDGATVVFVTEVVEVTEEIPEWAITPDEKLGRLSKFSPQCVNETAS